ncbi:hypothetical protein ITJ64_05500 [Herbiconiux sp. VKM Ac-1786]|uniref:hypothetical protein n=1 Tax=Herbiconiux sp. VKM Ac-1786 TaxID=2783824 RepID=UPI00188D68B4|nr:hypothetical protein [Herbiconiux sp. VKM Ac-1786]MBF4571967.1 hypothetical protein [Herbiconiux sp. VKM Ac-1786]
MTDTRPSRVSVLFVVTAVVAAFVLLVAGGVAGWLIADPARADAAPASTTTPGADLPERDFFFQVIGYDTANQGGQTLNMYFHYRYDRGIQAKDIPNYIDLRTDAIDFMDAVDAAENPYWEILDEQLCTQLANGYPLESISCQLQVYPDDRAGLPYEPGYHGTTFTIGDIEPLAVPGPSTSVQQCSISDPSCQDEQ